MPSTPHCGYSGVSPDGNCASSIEVLSRPTQSQSDEPSDLRGSLGPTTRHRCPSVYDTWQSQAVTHSIMNRARRCLTSVTKPTPMRQRRIPYIIYHSLIVLFQMFCVERNTESNGVTHKNNRYQVG